MGLAESIRSWTAEELAALLAGRPELAVPAPRSLDEVVARATSPYAVQTALQRLDRSGLDVLSAVAHLGGDATPASIAALALVAPDPDALGAVIERLRLLALVERTAGRLVAVPAVLRVLTTPFGLRSPLARALDRLGKQELADLGVALGVPSVSGKVGQIRLITDDLLVQGRIERLVDAAGDGAFDVLAAIDRAGGVVPLSTHRFARPQLPAPVRRLLELGLLVPFGPDLVELPREVAIVVRGGAPIAELRLTAPVPVAADAGERAALASLTTLSPVEVTDRVGAIVVRLAEAPLLGLKSGGVSVKDVKAIARDLHVADVDAARLLELAHVAGLIAGSFAGPIQTSADGHAWLQRPAPQRWVHLARSWALSGIDVARAWRRDHADRPLPPLADTAPTSSGTVRRRARLTRRLVDAASALDAPVSPASLVAGLAFDGAVDWSAGDDLVDPSDRVDGLLSELALLGLLSAGVPTPGLGLLLDADLGDTDGPDRLAAWAEGRFPQTVATFTVQADLTAIAPAELDPSVAGELSVMADPVSRSAVSVLRFTDASLRRALDRGRDVDAILGFLRSHARPSVPQALEVLVTDVGRRHGRVRVGAAAAYIRTDDAALLAEVTRHRKLAKLDLRVIAATVAVSGEPPRKLVAALREAGFLPAIDGDGVEVAVAPTSDRLLRQASRHRDAASAWAGGAARRRDGSPDVARSTFAVAELLARSKR